MDFDEQFNLGHLLLDIRKCRVCGQEKNLVDGFYRTRKDRGPVSSSYSYECKECCKKRVKKKKKPDIPYDPVLRIKDVYPDW
jgi:hypothetical protein